MKLIDYKYGMLVTDGDRVGSIVGVTNNAGNSDIIVRRELGRAIFLVEWSSGEKGGIHPANISKFKG